MVIADFINGAFELAGGIFILNHCRVLLADRRVAGVSKLSTAVFCAWGFWNLYYYPSLDQWLSFAGGIAIVLANCLYIGMLVYFSRYPGGRCQWRPLMFGGSCPRCGGTSGNIVNCLRGLSR